MDVLQSYARLRLQKLLDTHLGIDACLEWWICLRNSNWAQDEVIDSNVFLSASDGYTDDAKLTSLVKQRAGQALLRFRDGVCRLDRDLICTILGPALSPGAVLLFLRYQDNLFGIACLEVRTDARGMIESCSEQLCSDLLYHLRRYQLSYFIRKNYRKELVFLGASEPQRKQDFFIERASQAELPVLILGEDGCEHEYVAYALHLAGERMALPFVFCDCLSGEYNDRDTLNLAFKQAQGGSLFLHNVDALPPRGQVALDDIIQEISENQSQARIIASSSQNVYAAVQRKEFYAPLLRHLDFLSTTLSPLRLRRGDIKELSEFFLFKYSGSSRVGLSEEAQKTLEAFVWWGNVEQLEKVIARLVVLRKGMQIEPGDIDLHVPEIARTPGPGILGTCLELQECQHIATEKVPTEALGFVGEDFQLSRCHSGVQKAINYLIKNYNKALSLQSVANHACVSPSHLCVLLKRHVGMSFKTLVLLLRVEKAKGLLAGRPELTVTDISQEVGFNELGHFEKTFKRIAGCTPSSFRQNLRKAETVEPPFKLGMGA